MKINDLFEVGIVERGLKIVMILIIPPLIISLIVVSWMILFKVLEILAS